MFIANVQIPTRPFKLPADGPLARFVPVIKNLEGRKWRGLVSMHEKMKG